MTTYRVTGAHSVAGHKPGSSFQAEYDEPHERYLVEAGHVKVVKHDNSKGGGKSDG